MINFSCTFLGMLLPFEFMNIVEFFHFVKAGQEFFLWWNTSFVPSVENTTMKFVFCLDCFPVEPHCYVHCYTVPKLNSQYVVQMLLLAMKRKGRKIDTSLSQEQNTVRGNSRGVKKKPWEKIKTKVFIWVASSVNSILGPGADSDRSCWSWGGVFSPCHVLYLGSRDTAGPARQLTTSRRKHATLVTLYSLAWG